MRHYPVRTTVPLATAALMLTGVGLAAPSAANMPSTAQGELVRYAAVAPNTEELPSGARARVRAIETGSGKTVVTLQARGFTANATYGAHAHYKPCGATGGAAGAHYQDEVDPAVTAAAAIPPLRDVETIASVDASYANPANEVWLDFTTDSEGNGSAQTVVDWQFRPSALGRSVVVHANHTSHGGTPPAGNAGARLGCLSVPF